MKKLNIIWVIGIMLTLASSVYSQNRNKKHLELVTNYLKYIKEPNWKIDTLAQRYLLFRSDESPKYTREERKVIISFAVSYLSTELQSINLNEIIIKPYLETDSAMQRMFLREETKDNVIIAYTKDKSFLRYFWIGDDNKIKSFVTFKRGKVFVLLN